MSHDTPPRAGYTVTALLAAVLLLLLPGAAPALAADPSSAGERIADALRTSPVYVADAYAGAVPPARQRQLAARIARTGLPIKVVLTPLVRGDAFDGDPEVLAGVVRDRLAQRELILITTDGDFADSLNGYEWPSDTHQSRDAAAAVGFLDEMRDAGLADRAAKAVDLVAEGDGTAVYEEATKDLDGSTPPTPSPRPSTSHSALPWWPLTAVPLVVLAAMLLLRSRRHRPTPLRDVVLASARAADEAAVRRRAEAEILALGEATRQADPATTPGLQRALDAYAAAGAVLDAARGLPDLAGALALTAEGRDALSGTSRPLCFFNPLHGESTTRRTWRPLGRREGLDIAPCARCGEALSKRRPPEVLTDTTPDGRTVPYFDVPAERSVWAATGYGSLLREADDGLANRVGRGDFSRGRRGHG
ncbi:hypothetical protein C3489_04985 [Streptomyces sp. Ru71]|uniref:hypothetical protein n=1 Tax=Streptomyces sp. Ru71 TaxID=2080746 RepID=UPI000CDD3D2D|nr:hypothetical protein [Streptomyces sp. Ru71]POX56411.1 hypothetical protein C3489_04985 [Streptomyces sp. Ru71]